ncbi:MAG: DUF1223 domain-containing protein [Phycisphaerae bacterium]
MTPTHRMLGQCGFCKMLIAGLLATAACGGAADAPPAGTTSKPVKLQAGPVPGTRQWRFASTKHQVALLELYTSQECNSCPPADAAISALPEQGYGLEKVVPLALHVSYWPNLGWTDTFAQDLFAARHRVIAYRAGSEGPYTPQIALNGSSRNQRGAELLKLIDRVNLRPPAINLSILVELAPAGGALQIFADADRSRVLTRRDTCEIYFIVFENHCLTTVTGGENKGKTLKQPCVVRHMGLPHTLPPDVDIMPMGHGVKIEPGWRIENLGVAVFVQRATDGAIVQACGGLLTPGSETVVK